METGVENDCPSLTKPAEFGLLPNLFLFISIDLSRIGQKLFFCEL